METFQVLAYPGCPGNGRLTTVVVQNAFNAAVKSDRPPLHNHSHGANCSQPHVRATKKYRQAVRDID